MEVDLAMGRLRSEIGSFSTETEARLLTNLGEAGERAGGGCWDGVRTELERGPDDRVGEEEPG